MSGLNLDKISGLSSSSGTKETVGRNNEVSVSVSGCL